MHLLQRHILKSVVFSCAAAAGLFGFVLIVGNALKDLLGYVLAGQLAPEVLVKLLALLVPYVGAYALPMGVLTGVLLVLGRMSAQHEITAMRAAGLSLGYVARPIYWVAAAGVVISLAVNFYYMPRARTAYKNTLAEAVRANPLNFIVEKTFIRDFPGVTVYVGKKDGELMKDFWVWELDADKRVQYFARARSGRFDFVEQDNKLVLTLSQVTAETRDTKDPEDFSRPHPLGASDEITFDLKLDNLLGKQSVRKKLSQLTLDELLAERKRLAAAPKATALEKMRVSIALHEKASSAFAVVALALIAIPLGIKTSRKETTANLGMAVALTLGFHFMTIMAGWLDQFPAVRPALLLWVPPLLFAGVGIWMFRRVGRA